MYKNNIILHLSLIDGIGPGAIQILLDKKSDSWEWNDLYHVTQLEIQETFGFSEEKAQKIVTGLNDISLLERELNLLEQHNIGWLTIMGDDYPELLKQIHLPPALLYFKGASIRNEQALAVVGSRAMNWYGKRVIEQLVPALVNAGFTIISGGALGVDSCAHQTALNQQGKTIVVLGSGLLQPYPSQNKRLFENVVQSGGTIISSFPLKAPALPGNFPARNRIITGLSRGCLVVQAAARSGAGITARFALEQGRDVFAVPGLIHDKLSAGCHRLIKQGAKLVHTADDILEEYHIYPAISKNRVINKEIARKNKLPPIHEQIISHCQSPIAIDALAEKTGLSLALLNEHLFEMQLKGLVHQQIGLWRLSE